MNRRNFITLSSASFVSLVLSRLAVRAGSTDNMTLPRRIEALLEAAWIDLTPLGTGGYGYRDITVSPLPSGNALSVFLSSPTLPVKAIRLSWDHHATADAKWLGDHWERTYGDLSWAHPTKGKRAPWYLLIHDKKHTACFGVKTGCNSFCWWNAYGNTLSLTLDVSSAGTGVLLGQRLLHAADIITTKNDDSESLFQTAQRFCRLLCEKPRLPQKPVYGINDWYYAYGNNSPSLILEQTRRLAQLATDTNNKPFSVIDAGWAAWSPQLPGDCCWQDDLSKPNEKFRDMHTMAEKIKAEHMRPGLWTRPLCAPHDTRPSLLLPTILGRDDPRKPVLDPSIEENIARVTTLFSTYKDWGFHLIKHDFTSFDITGRWGFQMTDRIAPEGWRFADNTRTTAEVIKHLYTAIRHAAGNMYLIGCNTFSHLSAGLFEINRIGDDTSGKEWARTRKMGVNTLAFRGCQHKTFYAADADCVGLTDQIPWDKNRQWMQLLAESGTPLFISAQPDALKTEQKIYIKNCFAQAAKPQPTGEPLDWLENQWPSSWHLNGHFAHFYWD